MCSNVCMPAPWRFGYALCTWLCISQSGSLSKRKKTSLILNTVPSSIKYFLFFKLTFKNSLNYSLYSLIMLWPLMWSVLSKKKKENLNIFQVLSRLHTVEKHLLNFKAHNRNINNSVHYLEYLAKLNTV